MADEVITDEQKSAQPTEPVGNIVAFPSRSVDESGNEQIATTPTRPGKIAKHQAQADRHNRRRAAYEMWLRDIPYIEIGRALNISNKTAFYDVRTYSEHLNGPKQRTVDARREQNYAQLSRVKRSLWGVMDDPSAKKVEKVMAASEIVKATEAQNRLMGLNMPMKIAATTPDGESWAPLQLTLQNLTTDQLLALQSLSDVKILPPAAIDAEVVNK